MPRSGSLTRTYRGDDNAFDVYVPHKDGRGLPAICVPDNFPDLVGALVFRTTTGIGVWMGTSGWSAYSIEQFAAAFVQPCGLRPGQWSAMTLTYKTGAAAGMNIALSLTAAVIEMAFRMSEELFAMTPLNG